jgi:hypothetical protein
MVYPVGASKSSADSDGLCPDGANPIGAAGLSPAFQRREHPMKRVRPERARDRRSLPGSNIVGISVLLAPLQDASS